MVSVRTLLILMATTYCDLIGYNRALNNVLGHIGSRLNNDRVVTTPSTEYYQTKKLLQMLELGKLKNARNYQSYLRSHSDNHKMTKRNASRNHRLEYYYKH